MKKWKCCNNTAIVFVEKHRGWLNKPLPTEKVLSRPETRKQIPGRPKELFSLSSRKTKRRKVQTLVQSHDLNELTYAVETGYRSVGKRDVAKIISQATTSSPRTLKRMRASCSSKKDSAPTPYSPEEALALLVDLKLTRHQYIELRKGAMARNVHIYPSYNTVLEAKKQSYP